MPPRSSPSGQPLSLKGRAMALLAQREQSVVELRRKLLQHARRIASADDQSTRPDAVEDAVDPAAQVDEVIAWLRQHDYLNEDRFVESRVHARAARFGASRIRRELAEHGLQLSPEAAADLRTSETARAGDVWQRKFGRAPVDANEQARQTRFLVARGFSPEVVRRLVRVERPSDARRAETGSVRESQASDD